MMVGDYKSYIEKLVIVKWLLSYRLALYTSKQIRLQENKMTM